MYLSNTISIVLLCATKVVSFQTPLSLSTSSLLSRSSITSLKSTIEDSITISSTSSTSSTIDTEPTTEEQQQDEFNWYKSWYPLVPIEYLDPSKPHQFTLLGIDMVIWNDTAESEKFEPKKKRKKRFGLFGRSKTNDDDIARKGQWRAFVDKCPHRLVPLSEGRVESDGSLLCSYHGWRFNGEGGLIDLPQSHEKEYNTIKQNPKSQCNSFPVQIINDVLWIWPESGPDANLESALTPAPVMPPPTDKHGNPIPEENILYNTYNFRELPYGADYFLENVVDPAHVPVSHHNVVGNRYSGPEPMKITTAKSLTKDGFEFDIQTSMKTHQEFKAPCLVSIDSEVNDQGARQILELYASPSKPGFCNHLGRLVLVKDDDGNVPNAFKQFTMPIPIWMNHLLAATFLNQDALFLHAQERVFHRDLNYKTSLSAEDEETVQGNASYKKLTFTPTQADKGVLLFRDWLRLKAGGRIPFQGGYNEMPPVDNEVVFDQWNSHTAKCQYCLGAYKNAKKVRLVTGAFALLMTVVRPGGKVASVASVGLLGGISFASHKVIGALRRMEFSHAEND